MQELAFTLRERDGVRDARAVDAGLAVDDFAPRLSFFFAAHNDLFEEVAKFRAARRMYARLMRERFGASDASCRLRFHTQTGGVTLTAQQPLNNVVRVAVQALAAVLGGTQSLHTNGYDEALALPTAEAATLALRTQQIVALRESGVAHTVDPLAGSYYVEQLTDELETARDGAAGSRSTSWAARRAAIEAGFFQEEIARSAYEHQLRVERGETVIVGVNRFADGSEPPVDPGARLLGARARSGRAAGGDARAARRGGASRAALAALRRGRGRLRRTRRGRARRLMPLIVDAVRARATRRRDQRRAPRAVGDVPVRNAASAQSRLDGSVNAGHWRLRSGLTVE